MLQCIIYSTLEDTWFPPHTIETFEMVRLDSG